VQDQRRQANRGEDDKEKNRDIALRELDKKRRELFSENEKTRALDQGAMARIQARA